jgi:hypothetical protein
MGIDEFLNGDLELRNALVGRRWFAELTNKQLRRGAGADRERWVRDSSCCRFSSVRTNAPFGRSQSHTRPLVEQHERGRAICFTFYWDGPLG